MEKGRKGGRKEVWSNTFIKEHHNLLKGFHKVDVIITVLLNLLEKDQL